MSKKSNRFSSEVRERAAHNVPMKFELNTLANQPKQANS